MNIPQVTNGHRANIIGKLEDSLTSLEQSLKRVSPDKWPAKPQPEAWSVGEVVHHLVLVEVQRLQQIKDILEGRAESAPARDGPAPRIETARSRKKKFKTGTKMEPTPGLPAKVLLGAIHRARKETLDFVQAADLDRLSQIWLNTISLGPLNGVEYFEFLAVHMERHVEQIEEIASEVAQSS